MIEFNISQHAKVCQKNQIFPGIDNWNIERKQDSDLLVQYDFRSAEDIKEQKNVVSNFFADPKVFNECKSLSGKVDARKYGEALQVYPRKDFNGNHSYPENIAVYKVKKEFDCAASIAENNPLHGSGGGKQYFTTIDREILIKDGYLELQEVKSTENFNHDLPWLKELEQKGISEKQIQELIPEKHKELIQNWLQGTPEQRERAQGIMEMEVEAEKLKKENESEFPEIQKQISDFASPDQSLEPKGIGEKTNISPLLDSMAMQSEIGTNAGMTDSVDHSQEEPEMELEY